MNGFNEKEIKPTIHNQGEIEMKFILMLIVLLISFGCNNRWDHTGKIKLEFRIAETKTSDKLQKMSMYKTGDIFYVHKRVLLTNSDIESVMITDWQGRPGIELSMTDSGRIKWAEITQQNIGGNIGMILDGKLVCAPLVRAKIDSGIAIINGIFTEEEAKTIAAGLRK